MTIVGIAGAIGSGKSHFQLKYALEMCQRKKKTLVTNFEINIEALKRYAQVMKYDWVLSLIKRDLITWIINPKKRIEVNSGGRRSYKTIANIEALMIPESVVCLDEAGIFLNARNFAQTTADLLADLCQSRKMGTDIVWAAQFDEQVDKQFRLLTQYWVHCKSVCFYSKKLRRPELKWKKIYYFTAFDYQNWLCNYKDRASHFKTKFAYSFNYEGGPLTRGDKILFDVYNSFDRLDYEEQRDRVRSSISCPIITRKHVKFINAAPEFLALPPASPPSPSPTGTHASVGGGGGADLNPPTQNPSTYELPSWLS